ncbi:MAG: TonB-dependent receptor, partial [Cyclobacteriaceae bacterium]
GVNSNDVNREVWDVNGSQQIFNSQLSNKYTSEYTYNRPGLNLRLIRQKFNILLGASWQTTKLSGNLISQGTEIEKSFDNVLPVARFNYDFTNFKRLRLDYETSMQEPTIQELQPVVDNNDPLNLSVGNPDLRPGYTHMIRTSFTAFDPGSFINLFTFITGRYTENAISTSQEVDMNLVRTTKPVNVSNNYSLDANIHFGLPIKKIKSRFGLSADATTSRAITLLNLMENSIRQRTLGGRLTYSYNLNDIFNLDLEASIQQQQSSYEFDVADQLFLNKTYEAEANLKVLKNYQLNSGFQYLDYSSQTTGFSQVVPLLDISVSRFLLKNNTGELKLGVKNLLDRNVSITPNFNSPV